MPESDNARHHAFLRAYSTHEAAVRAFVRRLVPTRADADDVMQEVSVVLWEKFDSLRDIADFRIWAFGVARFEVLAWLRDKGRDRLILGDDVVSRIADDAARDEPRLSRQREALEDCIQGLEHAQRDLLMRAYQSEARIQDVARTSGRSVAGFYQWLHRVRRRLLDCVRGQLSSEASE